MVDCCRKAIVEQRVLLEVPDRAQKRGAVALDLRRAEAGDPCQRFLRLRPLLRQFDEGGVMANDIRRELRLDGELEAQRLQRLIERLVVGGNIAR